MTDKNKTSAFQWSVKQALLLGALSLAAGIAGGWVIRSWQVAPASADTEPAAAIQAAPAATPAPPEPMGPTPAQLQQMADAQAAPLLNKLKSDANNADLLAGIGNVYYDAHLYPAAIDYYGRALKIKPSDADVRTDMGTAYWFMRNADSALAEFDKALSYAPNNPNTLFNRGLVRWQGKADGAGALADWEKLLKVSPNYEQKATVEQMVAEVKKHGQQASANRQ